MHATFGSEHEDVWVEPSCVWCAGDEADETPCSDECASMAVRAARTRRIVGCVDAIQKALRLRMQYVAEGIRGDQRIAAVDRVIADYDRQIHEAVVAQQRDDGHGEEDGMSITALVSFGWKTRASHVELDGLDELAQLVRALRVGTHVAVFDGPTLCAHFVVSRQIRSGADRIAEAAWERWVAA